jgi:hypothetical protein
MIRNLYPQNPGRHLSLSARVPLLIKHIARLLKQLRRNDLITLSTVTYTSMQGLGYTLGYRLCFIEICLVGIKSKAIACSNVYISLYVDSSNSHLRIRREGYERM